MHSTLRVLFCDTKTSKYLTKFRLCCSQKFHKNSISGFAATIIHYLQHCEFYISVLEYYLLFLRLSANLDVEEVKEVKEELEVEEINNAR